MGVGRGPDRYNARRFGAHFPACPRISAQDNAQDRRDLAVIVHLTIRLSSPASMAATREGMAGQGYCATIHLFYHYLVLREGYWGRDHRISQQSGLCAVRLHQPRLSLRVTEVRCRSMLSSLASSITGIPIVQCLVIVHSVLALLELILVLFILPTLLTLFLVLFYILLLILLVIFLFIGH